MASALPLPLSLPHPQREYSPERAVGAHRCAVCGNDDVHCDSVRDGDVLHLAQCPRCDHRWTWREAGEHDVVPVRPRKCIERGAIDWRPARFSEEAA